MSYKLDRKQLPRAYKIMKKKKYVKNTNIYTDKIKRARQNFLTFRF